MPVAAHVNATAASAHGDADSCDMPDTAHKPQVLPLLLLTCSTGKTPLMFAAHHGHWNIVNYLLQKVINLASWLVFGGSFGGKACNVVGWRVCCGADCWIGIG